MSVSRISFALGLPSTESTATISDSTVSSRAPRASTHSAVAGSLSISMIWLFTLLATVASSWSVASVSRGTVPLRVNVLCDRDTAQREPLMRGALYSLRGSGRRGPSTEAQRDVGGSGR